MLVRKYVSFSKKHLKKKNDDDKKYCKVRHHCHYAGKYKLPASSICNLRYSIPKEISIVVFNASNYDYYFIVTELGLPSQSLIACEKINKKIRNFFVSCSKLLSCLK